jgi:Tfp pilus assembly protein PilN
VIDMVRRRRLGIVLIADRLIGAIVRPGRAVETFSIVNADNPAVAVRAELDARGLRPRAARVAIQRNLVTVKPLDLPSTADSELEEMVRFEVDRHVPFPADDALVDFTVLPTDGEGRRVLLLAAERRVVDRALQLMAEAKIRATSVTVAPHDLLSLLSRQRAGQRAIWVHRVGDTADLLVLRGNTLAMSRSILGSDPGNLASELRRTLGMFRWRECDAIWVSGDDAVHALESAALAALGTPVTSPPVSPRVRRALGESDGAAWLAAAVAMSSRTPRLNLLPLALRPRRLSRGQLVKIALVIVTVGLGLLSLFAQGMRNSRHLARVNAEIRQLDADVASVERLRREVERGRRLLETVRATDAANLRLLPVLRELTELLPADVWLMTLWLDQKGVEMTGQASVASGLIPLVENSPRFERAEFASPVTRGRDKEQFRIKAAWEAAPESAPGRTVAPTGKPTSGSPSSDRIPVSPSTPSTPDPDGAPRASRPGGRVPAAPRTETIGTPPLEIPAARRSAP